MLYEDFYNDISHRLDVKQKVRSLLNLDYRIDEISSLIPCTPSAVVEVINEVASATHQNILYEKVESVVDKICRGRKPISKGERLLTEILERTFTKKQLREIRNGKTDRGNKS